ncbi:protein phosphatase 2C domain-containing protein [Streptomyces phaeochromogenes]
MTARSGTPRKLIMRVSIDTRPGGTGPNEDWVAGTPTLAVVLDGLSTAGLDTGCRHGVPWYVSHLGGALVAALANPSRPLTNALEAALEQVASLHPECDLNNPGTPSATVAVLRQRGDQLDHLVLADSPVVFEGRAGYSTITDLRVDNVLPELRAAVEQFETHTPEHREALQHLVVEQRKARNTAAGYWVAAASPEAAQHAVTGSTPGDEVQAAAVMSDGVSRLVTEYKMATWARVFASLRSGGPAELIDTVRKVEATDPTGVRWPKGCPINDLRRVRWPACPLVTH